MWENNKIKLDFDNMQEAKKCLKLLRILKIKGQYRISSSGRGYHFNLETLKHNKKENLIIRYILGDCYGRLTADKRRLQNGIKEFDLLFDIKNNKKSKKWRKI